MRAGTTTCCADEEAQAHTESAHPWSGHHDAPPILSQGRRNAHRCPTRSARVRLGVKHGSWRRRERRRRLPSSIPISRFWRVHLRPATVTSDPAVPHLHAEAHSDPQRAARGDPPHLSRHCYRDPDLLRRPAQPLHAHGRQLALRPRLPPLQDRRAAPCRIPLSAKRGYPERPVVLRGGRRGRGRPRLGRLRRPWPGGIDCCAGGASVATSLASCVVERSACRRSGRGPVFPLGTSRGSRLPAREDG